MIILDTNVISEPMKPNRQGAVMAWLDQQSAETLFFTSISLSELLLGIELMPQSKRRAGLSAELEGVIQRLFGPRILSFDAKAASSYALLAARAQARGQSISHADGQIAAIALTHGFIVATRDTAPFIAAGVEVIDPFRITTT